MAVVVLSNGNLPGSSTAVLTVETVETALRFPVAVVVVVAALENNETRA